MSGSRIFLPGMEGTAAPADAQEGTRHALPGTDLEFILKRDGRIRISISLEADGTPLVKAPATASLETIYAALRRKLDWIAQSRALFAAPGMETLRLPGTGLEFILKRDRFQSLRLSVLPGSLPLVKAPAGEPLESIHAFVRSHLEGILKAQRRRHAPEKKERPGSP
ncbi:MAG: hypothetical protein IKS68_00345, partial [Mailhella sp.]|nr:hypothetical protein [Mailhella sp.]